MLLEKNLLEKSIVELIVEESAEKVAKHRKSAIAHLESHADIKGFRKGTKIPESVLVKQYGEDQIAKMTIDAAIDSMYKEAIKKENLIPVAQAEIKEIISESPLKIKIHIEVFPIIEVDAKYKKIKLKKKAIAVADSEVENALSEIETKFTKFEEADDKYKITEGDKVTVDTDGYEGEKILEATSMRDYPIVLGSNVLVPGFESGMVGAKNGDKLELDITFPKDYHNTAFAGKKTVFKVTIKKVEKAVKPEFNEEFIEQLRGKKLDLKGFKELIKTEISDTKESNARIEEEQKLVEELVKISKIDLGDALLKNQIEKVYNEIKENITKDGLKVADYLESLKLSEEAYKEKNVKPIALKRLQGELILHKLMEIEKIEITEEEANKEIETILVKFENPEVLEKLKTMYVPGNKYYEELKQRIGYRKLIDSFFEA